MRTKKISEFAKVRRGASPRPIEDPKYFGGNVGWVRIADVTASRKYLRSTSQYLSPLGEQYSVRVDKGDLIMSIAGTVGRPMLVDMPACIHDGFVQIYDLQEADAEFLYYNLQFIEDTLRSSGQSGTQTNLNTGIVNNTELYFPLKPEQARIAEVLSVADRAIEQTEALIAKYQRIKTGLMHDLLTRGIDERGCLRDPTTHEFKPSPLGMIPVEWEICRLGEVTHRLGVGLATSVTKHYREKGVPIIRNLNIRKGFFDDSDMLYLDPAFAAQFPNKQVLEGDVLTCHTGSNVGDTCLAPAKYIGSQTFTTLITTTNRLKLLPEFLVQYLNADTGLKELGNVLVGSGKDNLNAGQFVNLRLPLPTPDEQAKIVRVLLEAGRAIEEQIKYNQKIHALKTGLMQDLLTGKVSVEPLQSKE